MNKIKIAFLPFYTKLYDDGHPERRIPLVAYMRKLIGDIESCGFDVVLPPADVCMDNVCRLKNEFDAAAKKFNADEDIVAVVTYHLAYSPSLEAIDALKSLKAPIIVFDTTPDYEFSGAALYDERSNANHGIHGVQEMCSMLRRNKKSFEIVTGHAMHSEVVTELAALLRAAAVAHEFRRARIGLAGFQFEGMGDFLIDDEVYKEKIGGEVFRLTKEEAANYLSQVTDAEIKEELAEDAMNFDIRVRNREAYWDVTKTSLAIRKWVDDKKLTALSINFLHVFENGLLKMPFPEACKEMRRGKGYAGEGDTLTAGLVGALTTVYPNTTFAEMFCPDWEKNLIFLSHYGEVNTRIAKFKPILKDDHFVYDPSGDTVVVGACMRSGKAVYVSLVPVDAENGHFDLVVAPITMTDTGEEVGEYASIVQGWFDPGKPIGDFLKAYSKAGGTHHGAIVYNVAPEDIAAFGTFMGFNTILI